MVEAWRCVAQNLGRSGWLSVRRLVHPHTAGLLQSGQADHGYPPIQGSDNVVGPRLPDVASRGGRAREPGDTTVNMDCGEAPGEGEKRSSAVKRQRSTQGSQAANKRTRKEGEDGARHPVPAEEGFPPEDISQEYVQLVRGPFCSNGECDDKWRTPGCTMRRLRED